MGLIWLLGTAWFPDALIRAGIRLLLANSLRRRYQPGFEQREAQKRALIEKLRRSPIALYAEDANRQHYEVPPEFFELVLGPWLKYSCCYWPAGVRTLDQAEAAMLRLTCERARLKDGMQVLDLGCGWGSLSLWIATHYPNCQVTAVSNAPSQRQFIENRCRRLGLDRVQAITADVADLHLERRFDRVLSIEMFEHMKNYEQLMAKIAAFLEPDGSLFVHLFSHREFAYEYPFDDPQDWMSHNFFRGGTMPSSDLLAYFQRDLELVEQWEITGTHYAHTLRAWLKGLDRQQPEVRQILAAAYGADDAPRKLAHWRLFFIACQETFNLRRGREYVVSHYLFQQRSAPSTAR